MSKRIATALLIGLLASFPAILPATVAADSHIDEARIVEILQALDDRSMPATTRLEFFHDDAVIMAPNEAPIRGRIALLKHLTDAAAAEGIQHTHYTRTVERFDNIVVAEGGGRGEWRDNPDSEPVAFATNNVILFREDDSGTLKIWKVIFNSAPVADDG